MGSRHLWGPVVFGKLSILEYRLMFVWFHFNFCFNFISYISKSKSIYVITKFISRYIQTKWEIKLIILIIRVCHQKKMGMLLHHIGILTLRILKLKLHLKQLFPSEIKISESLTKLSSFFVWSNKNNTYYS